MSLISVPAGRCNRRPGTKWVDPDPVKGSIELSIEDDLLHVSWKNRASGTIEDDLIIFPGEASFEKVTQDPTGRTHILKFTSSDQKYFFWFQRTSTTSDARAQVDIHNFLQDPSYRAGSAPLPEISQPSQVPSINQIPETPQGSSSNIDRGADGSWPPTPGAPRLAHASPLPASSNSLAARSGLGLASNSADSPSPATATSTAGASGGSANPQEEMARLLVQWAQSGGIPSGGADDPARLTDVLSPANITTLINAHPEIGARIAPHLPTSLGISGQPSPKDVLPILVAPQFTDAIGSLDEALRSGGLPGSMMRELGLPEGAGQSVTAFLEALRGLQGDAVDAADADDKMDTD